MNLLKEHPSHEVSNFQAVTYALPMVVSGFLLYPTMVILAGIYAKYFGLALGTISLAVLIARLFDVITDPVIGYLSDRYRVRTGTRKPWIAAGCVGAVIASYYLFVPPVQVSFVYFLGWYMVFYLAVTAIDIPHLAWGGELTSCSYRKNTVYSLRAGCIFLGMILYTILPLLPFFADEGFTPHTLKWSSLACAIVAIPACILCVKFTPNGRPSPTMVSENSRRILQAIVSNKPFVILISGYGTYAIAGGMLMGLLYIFADTHLALGQNLPLVFTLANAPGIIAAMIVCRLPERFEKSTIYALLAVISTVVLTGLGLLNAGDNTLIYFVSLYMVYTFCNAAINIVVPSMMSDIADYGTWKFGSNRAAMYFSCYSLLVKTAFGMGMALSLAVAGWFNFDPAATSQTETAILGLRAAMAYIPALLIFLSLFFILKSPISAHKHRVIQQRLAARYRQQHTVEPTPTFNAAESHA